ncbi:hypothetical protein ACWGBV_03065 [Streptomyces sp. NPDC055051]
MPTDATKDGLPELAGLDHAQACFEALAADGVPLSAAYAYANRLLPPGADLRAIHDELESS